MRLRSRILLLAAALSASSGAAFAQSLEKGETIFRQRCMTCHGLGAMAAYSPGPAIAGVANRPIASLPNYEYTTALKAVRGVWTAGTLDSFLKSPQGFAPGTSMSLALPDDKERRDLIAYLQTLR